MNLRLRNFNWMLALIVALLMIFSWPYMRSASYRSGPEGKGYYTSSPEKQMMWAGAGVVAAIVLLLINYRMLVNAGLALYGGGIVLLVLVFLFGRTVNGARSWLDFPGGVRLQPSEFVKIATVLALAHFLAPEARAKRFGNVLAALALAGLPALLIIMQPDLGSALMFLPAAIAMLVVAGIRVKHLILLAVLAVVLSPLAWLGMNNTQRGRVYVWLGQNRKLTQAERVGQFHHLIQSKIAIGSGGVTGKGLGEGTQNKLNYLGFRNTDFIFAVICEEAGFVGAIAVIFLYLMFVGTGLSIAEHCREPAGRLVAVGITALFGVQGLVNIAMTTGLLPIVGVTLPFVSYGGSSTVASLLGVSLLLNVALRRPSVTFARSELAEMDMVKKNGRR